MGRDSTRRELIIHRDLGLLVTAVIATRTVIAMLDGGLRPLRCFGTVQLLGQGVLRGLLFGSRLHAAFCAAGSLRAAGLPSGLSDVHQHAPVADSLALELVASVPRPELHVLHGALRR